MEDSNGRQSANNEYMKTAEVARLLHVSPKTVSRWAKEEKLPFVKTLGGHRRFPAEAIRRIAAQLDEQAQLVDSPD